MDTLMAVWTGYEIRELDPCTVLADRVGYLRDNFHLLNAKMLLVA